MASASKPSRPCKSQIALAALFDFPSVLLVRNRSPHKFAQRWNSYEKHPCRRQFELIVCVLGRLGNTALASATRKIGAKNDGAIPKIVGFEVARCSNADVGCWHHFAGRSCTRRRLSSRTQFSCSRRNPLVLPIGSGHSAQVLVHACSRSADATSGCPY
jgi:hypothetical protein